MRQKDPWIKKKTIRMIQKDPWNHVEINQYDTERSMDPWKLIRMIQKYPRICVL
jgi:hypothetical protein